MKVLLLLLIGKREVLVCTSNWLDEECENGWQQCLQEKGCGQRRIMCQARIGELVLWDKVNRKEELGWFSSS